MKTIMSCLVALACSFANAASICHIFETNSVSGKRAFHPFSAKLVRLLPMPKYNTNGLVHMYDSEINVGIGLHQDGFVPVWKDLYGNVDLTITSDLLTFGKKHLFMPKIKTGSGMLTVWSERTSGIAIANTRIPDNEIVTVEVCAAVQPQYMNVYSPSQTKFDVLVSNGDMLDTGDMYWAASHFLAMCCDMGNNRSWGGKPYRLIFGRGADCSIRCKSFSSNYDLFPANMSWNQFTVSYSCVDKTITRPPSGQPYYQPFYNSPALYCNFVYPSWGTPSFDNCKFVASDTAPTYSTDGWRDNSTSKLNTTKINDTPFTIGGISYSTWGGGRTEGQFWSGYIFCVRIYDRVLTDQERRANMKIDFERFGAGTYPSN